jgi:hypothetical protein
MKGFRIMIMRPEQAAYDLSSIYPQKRLPGSLKVV